MTPPLTYFRLSDPEVWCVKPVYQITTKDQIKLLARVETLLGVTVALPRLQVGHLQLRGLRLHVLHKPIGVVISTHL